MIMYDIVELAAQIGGMHSNNPIINYVYKLRKKKKLHDLIKRINKLPEAPSDDDIFYFSIMLPKWYGMDFDSDYIRFKHDTITIKIYNMANCVKYYIMHGDKKNGYWIVTVRRGSNDIQFENTSINGNKNGMQNKNDVRKAIGIGMKIALGQICSDLILGGK